MKDLIIDVEQWFVKRDLDKNDPSKQVLKLSEEMGELIEGIVKNNVDLIKDAVGDMMVVMIGYVLQRDDLEFDFSKNYGITMNSAENCYYEISQNVYYLNYNVGNAGNVLENVMQYLNTIAYHYGTSLQSCLKLAYDEIENRRGKTINGIFVKWQDLPIEIQFEELGYRKQVVGDIVRYTKSSPNGCDSITFWDDNDVELYSDFEDGFSMTKDIAELVVKGMSV